jgi:hypothetical protein
MSNENFHVIPYGQLTDEEVHVGDIVLMNLEIEQPSRRYRNQTETKRYDVTAVVDDKGPYIAEEDEETKEGIFYQLTVMSHGSLMGYEVKNIEIKDIASID